MKTSKDFLKEYLEICKHGFMEVKGEDIIYEHPSLIVQHFIDFVIEETNWAFDDIQKDIKSGRLVSSII